MTEDQLSQLWTVRGLMRLLDQCCDGKNVHHVSQYRQVLTLLEDFLKQGDQPPERLARSKERIREVKREVLKLYREWEALQ